MLKDKKEIEHVISSVSERNNTSELYILKTALVELYPDQLETYKKLLIENPDPTAHIKIPEATQGDLEWAKSMEGKWKRGLSQELAKVSNRGYIWRVKYLLDLKDKDGNRKVNVYKSTSFDRRDSTPLCHAINKEHYNVMELLLSSGVSLNIEKGTGPELTASYQKNEIIWHILFKHNLSIDKAVTAIRKIDYAAATNVLERVLGELYPEQLESYGFQPFKEMLPPTEDSETEVAVISSEEQEMPALVQDKTEIADISLSKEWERVAGSDDEIVHTSLIKSTGIVKQAIFNFKERSVTMLFQTNGVMATPVIRNFKDIEGEDSLFEAYAELEKQGAKPPVFLGQNLVTVGKNTPNKKRVTFSQK